MKLFRYAVRSLVRSPGLTAAAVLTLALGVAANTTVFAWVRAVLLDPIPSAADAGRLRVVFARSPSGEPARLSWLDARDLGRRTDVFQGLIGQQWVNVASGASGARSAERLSGALVSGNYFEVLGVRLVVGRGFRAGEDSGRGSPPVVVLSYALWERSFAADRGIVGRAVLLNSQPFTVVGVAPPRFYGSFLSIGTDVWIPLSQVARFDPAGDRTLDRGDRWLLTLARLAPSVATGRAREALRAETARWKREFPAAHEGYGLEIAPLSSSPWGGPAELGPIVSVLAMLVALILLIASASVANVLVSRALARRREIAVRLALGATRWQIARQSLVEALVLAGLAAVAAVIATTWTSGLLVSFIPPTGFPVRFDLSVDPLIVAYALGISFAASLLSGLLAAIQASRSLVASELAAQSATVVGPRRTRWRGGLVGAQMALSLVLLAAAALFLRSLAASRALDPGFDTRRLLLVGLKLFPAGYTRETGAALLDRVQERVRDLPGVRAAALARRAPLGFGAFPSTSIRTEGVALRPEEAAGVRLDNVSPGYFQALGVAMRRGRDFDRSDRIDSEPVAIVNETLARRFFSGREALGGRVESSGVWRRVVGVVADSKYERLREAPLSVLFVPFAQAPSSDAELHVRTLGEPSGVLPAVSEVLREIDPNLPAFEVQTMDQHLGEELFGERIGSALLGVLGVLAIVISAVGLAALTAYSVVERRREIGVRIVLGASPRLVVGTLLGRGMRLTALGAGAGLAAAAASGRLIASRLPAIAPWDPLAFAAVTGIVMMIAFLAALLPARRAARVPPAEALRSE